MTRSPYGKPEPAARRCGEEIARLRTSRGWSRAKLIVRLYDQLDLTDPCYDSISEAWLARLEAGHTVKISRQTIEACCCALHCTRQERARVLLYADRNILNSASETPSVVAEVLNLTLDRIGRDAHDIVANLIGPRSAYELDEHEMLELVATALGLVIARRRKRPT